MIMKSDKLFDAACIATMLFFFGIAFVACLFSVGWGLARVANHYSSLILPLATHQERNESTHQEKNKTWSSRKKQDPIVKKLVKFLIRLLRLLLLILK